MHELPAPDVPDPHETPALRWGILGTGWIASQFVGALQRSTSQVVQAVGSRGTGRAREFAGRFDIAEAHGSYESLVASPDVDVVYVATGHLDHFAHAKLALEAGKPVLVEKPFTPRLSEARELADLARERGLFMMEAVWTLALPRYSVMRQVLEQGALGDIVSVTADIGEHMLDHHRAMDPAQGGGAMNDLGLYPFMFANEILPGLRVDAAEGWRHPEHGSIGQLHALLSDDTGRQATLTVSMLTDTPTSAVIAGTEGMLLLQEQFCRDGDVEVRFRDGRVLRYEEERIDHAAIFWEALEVARCIHAGLAESPVRPLGSTVATVQLMEQARELMGDPLQV